MGRDKAGLASPPFRNLLDRQVAVLRASGSRECLISARVGQRLPDRPVGAGDRLVLDDGTAGPLGGLVAVLRAARSTHVLTLGVDLARIDAAMLRRIVGAMPAGQSGVGIIPRTTAAPQPLAGVWPRTMLVMAEAQLAAGLDLSLRALVTAGIDAGLLHWYDVPAWDAWRFANWNRPTDIRPHQTS